MIYIFAPMQTLMYSMLLRKYAYVQERQHEHLHASVYAWLRAWGKGMISQDRLRTGGHTAERTTNCPYNLGEFEIIFTAAVWCELGDKMDSFHKKR